MQKEFNNTKPFPGWFSPEAALDMGELMRLAQGFANITAEKPLIIDYGPPYGVHLRLESSATDAPSTTIYTVDTSLAPGSDQNDYALPATINDITPTTNINITGILIIGVVIGQVINIRNISTNYYITLKHQDTNSTTTNRFNFFPATDYVIPPGQSATVSTTA